MAATVIHHVPARLRREALALFDQTLALAGNASALFFAFTGDAHRAEAAVIAPQVTIQAQPHLRRIARIGFDVFTVLVPIDRTDHVIGDAHLRETPVQAVSERAGFVATMELLAPLLELLRPVQERFRGKPFRSLWRTTVDLHYHDVFFDVNVDAGCGHDSRRTHPEFDKSVSDALHVPMVALWISDENIEDLSSEDTNRLAQLFHERAIVKFARHGCQIVETPGDRPLTLRLALTELQAANPCGGFVTTTAPYLSTAVSA